MNTKHHILGRSILPHNKQILADQTIILTGVRADKCSHDLRLVRSSDPETGGILDVFTNSHRLGASTLSGTKRELWR